MDQFQKLEERKLNSEKIFDGEVLHVIRDTVELPNGKSATREVIRHVGAVGIVPMTENGAVVIERQYRYPIDQVITEIPAGKLDDPSEDRLEAARRELQEETGLTAESWTYIGEYHPAAAYSDERITLYLARGLTQGERNLDEDEFLNLEEVPLEKLIQDIMDGRITDGKTQTALMRVALLCGAIAAED